MVAEMGLFPGVSEYDQVLDLYWHPLFKEEWAPAVKSAEIVPLPLETVSTTESGPRVNRGGIVIFTLSTEGPRTAPKVVLPHEPIARISTAVKVAVVDAPASELASLMQAMKGGVFDSAEIRDHRRSRTSMKVAPRLAIEVAFPVGMPDFYITDAFQELRRSTFSEGTVWGMQTLYTSRDALILEAPAQSALRFWPLCGQMLAIAAKKALVFTGASARTWRGQMDAALREDTSGASYRLKWKASKKGGATVAKPTATEEALAAGRRIEAAGAAADTLYIAEIAVQGDIGREDGEVIALLMNHAAATAGLVLRETGYDRAPREGEYARATRINDDGRPGVVRVYLGEREAARRVHNAFQGRHVQVGTTVVGFSVRCDALAAEQLPGGGPRRA